MLQVKYIQYVGDGIESVENVGHDLLLYLYKKNHTVL